MTNKAIESCYKIIQKEDCSGWNIYKQSKGEWEKLVDSEGEEIILSDQTSLSNYILKLIKKEGKEREEQQLKIQKEYEEQINNAIYKLKLIFGITTFSPTWQHFCVEHSIKTLLTLVDIYIYLQKIVENFSNKFKS